MHPTFWRKARSHLGNTRTSFIIEGGRPVTDVTRRNSRERIGGENLRRGIKISFYCARRSEERGERTWRNRSRNDGAIMEGKYGAHS